MKHALKSLTPVLTAQALLCAGTPAPAADVGERTMRFGYGVPEEHPIGRGVNKFVELVGQNSGGKVKVRAFPSGALGVSKARTFLTSARRDL